MVRRWIEFFFHQKKRGEGEEKQEEAEYVVQGIKP